MRNSLSHQILENSAAVVTADADGKGHRIDGIAGEFSSAGISTDLDLPALAWMGDPWRSLPGDGNGCGTLYSRHTAALLREGEEREEDTGPSPLPATRERGKRQ